MPTVSRISFDFLHYIRPPSEATSAPKESFEQLVRFLTGWDSCHNGGDNSVDDRGVENGHVNDDNANDGNAVDGNVTTGIANGCVKDSNDNRGNGGSVKDGNSKADNKLMSRRERVRLTLNLLRSLCHIFYFDCSQVFF